MGRRCLVTLAVTMVLALSTMPGAGFAGGINPFPNDVDNLTSGEADAIKEALRTALTTYKTGTTVNWTSPDSKRTGRVKINKTFERNGKHCATVENKFTNGTGNTYSLPLCEMPDGSWKVSF